MKPAPKVIDLFSGVGGFSLGAARAGFSLACAVEIDLQANEAHRLNFRKTPHLARDISQLSGKEILRHANITRGTLSGLIGGPPCQGFSSMGQNRKRDSRNALFGHFFRLVDEMRPVFFMAENVPGILNPKFRYFRDSGLDRVSRHYDLLAPITMRADEWGAPTSRTRVFFIGVRSDAGRKISEMDFKPPSDATRVVVRDALRGLPKKLKPSWREDCGGWRVVHHQGNDHFSSRLHGHVPTGVGNLIALKRLRDERKASGFLSTYHSAAVLRRYKGIKPGTRDPISKSHKLELDGICPTLRAGTGFDRGRFQAVRPLHPTEDRVITPREAARLQGFPDWFQFSNTRWHSFRLIGNSVSPILAERVLSVMHRVIS